jgi:hypothetical protein
LSGEATGLDDEILIINEPFDVQQFQRIKITRLVANISVVVSYDDQAKRQRKYHFWGIFPSSTTQGTKTIQRTAK